MALELVSSGLILSNLTPRASPGDLGGSRGRFPSGIQKSECRSRARNGSSARARHTCYGGFSAPDSRRLGPRIALEKPFRTTSHPPFLARSPLKFRLKSPPGTLLDHRGPPRTSISTENQPRKPILTPSGNVCGQQKVWYADASQAASRGTDRKRWFQVTPQIIPAESQETPLSVTVQVFERCRTHGFGPVEAVACRDKLLSNL